MIVYAGNKETANKIAIDEGAQDLHFKYSCFIMSVVSSEIVPETFIDDGGEPSSAIMMQTMHM